MAQCKRSRAQGVTHCIEMGPHPVLLGMAADCLPGQQIEWLPSLRRDRPAWSDLIESVQRLYVDGAEIDWDGFERDYRRRRVALPTYPFRRRRYWMDSVGPTGGSDLRGHRGRYAGHAPDQAVSPPGQSRDRSI